MMKLRDLKNCKQVKRAVMDESAEGGEITAYFSGPSLRKLVGIFFGETGKTVEEYYFWDERLIFVLRINSNYDKPLSGVIRSQSEERFYFADDTLIRWLDSGKKEVAAGSAFEERGREYLELTKRFSDLVRKEDADPR